MRPDVERRHVHDANRVSMKVMEEACCQAAMQSDELQLVQRCSWQFSL